MESITEYIVRTADLAEAEGRLLRSTTMRVALGIATILVAVGAVIAGLGLLLTAVYIAVAHEAGPALGAVVAGAIALIIGGALTWLGRRIGT